MSYIFVSNRVRKLILLGNGTADRYSRKYTTNDLVYYYRNPSFRLSMVTSDETETFYLDIPPTSSSHLPRTDRSMDRSTIQINPTTTSTNTSTSTKIYRSTQYPKDFDNERIVLQKHFLFFSKKKNESDDIRVIIRVKGIRCENNENVIADESDKSLHTANLSTTDYANLGGEEYLTKKERRKTLSKLFQCHK